MRVIILGGSGFIGRALTQALISRGDEVVVPTRHVPAATPSTGPEYQLWDGVEVCLPSCSRCFSLGLEGRWGQEGSRSLGFILTMK